MSTPQGSRLYNQWRSKVDKKGTLNLNHSAQTTKNLSIVDDQATGQLYANLVLLKFSKRLISFLLGVALLVCLCLNTDFLDYVTQTKPKDASQFRENVTPLVASMIPTLCISLLGTLIFEKHDEDKNERKLLVFSMAIITSVGQGIGECFFFLVVLPDYDNLRTLTVKYMWCLLPMLFLFVHNLIVLKRSRNNQNHVSNDTHSSSKLGIAIGLSLVCLLIGVGGFVIFFMFPARNSHTIELVIATFLNSFFFWRNYIYNYNLAVSNTLQRHRYKIGLTKAFCKLITICSTSVLIGDFYYNLNWKDILEARYWDVSTEYHFAIGGLVISGHLAYLILYAAVLGEFDRMGFAIPLVLAPVVSTVWQLFKCDSPMKQYLLSGACEHDSKNVTLSLIEIGMLLVPYWYIIVSQLGKKRTLRNERDIWFLTEMNAINASVWIAVNRNRQKPIEKSFTRKHIYVAITAWHEGKEEIANSVKAVLGLAKNNYGRIRFSYHFIVDDAIREDGQLNDYANDLRQVMFAEGGRCFEIDNTHDTTKICKNIWYGGTELFYFNNYNNAQIEIHYKDCKRKVKQKKRWSQILYMNLFFKDSHHKMEQENAHIADPKKKLTLENFYILMLDCDTRFEAKDVRLLIDSLERDPTRTGAVCGRIFPEGTAFANPIVWFQKFEYGVAHWLNKAAEDIYGSVLCCPGCFTLVSMYALRHRVKQKLKSCDGPKNNQPISETQPLLSDGSFKGYSVPLSSEEDPNEEIQCAALSYFKTCQNGMDVLMFDQGEDRLLCTLLIQHGWKLGYCSSAHSFTHCPETFSGFLKQRRRWVISTLANIAYLVSKWQEICKENRSVSALYMFYTLAMLISAILSPITVVIVFMGGLQFAFGLSLPWSCALSLAPALFYVGLCIHYAVELKDPSDLKEKKIDIQILVAQVLCVLLGLLIMASFLAILSNASIYGFRIDIMYLVALSGLFVLSSLLHFEVITLFYGLPYLFFLPTMYMILIIYAINNLQDQSWGTRDASSQPQSVQTITHRTSDEESIEQGQKIDETDVQKRFHRTTMVTSFQEVFLKKTERSIAAEPEINPEQNVPDPAPANNSNNQTQPAPVPRSLEVMQRDISLKLKKNVVIINDDHPNGHSALVSDPYFFTKPGGFFIRHKQNQVGCLLTREDESLANDFLPQIVYKDIERLQLHSANTAEAIEEQVSRYSTLICILSKKSLNDYRFQFALNVAVFYDVKIIMLKYLDNSDLLDYPKLAEHKSMKTAIEIKEKWRTQDELRKRIQEIVKNSVATNATNSTPAAPSVQQAGAVNPPKALKQEILDFFKSIYNFFTPKSTSSMANGYVNLFDRKLVDFPPYFVQQDTNGFVALKPLFHEKFRQAVVIPSWPIPKYDQDISKDLIDKRSSFGRLMLAVSFGWLLVMILLSTHVELEIHKMNVLGMAFVAVFGILTILQFFATILCRLGTLLRIFSLVGRKAKPKQAQSESQQPTHPPQEPIPSRQSTRPRSQNGSQTLTTVQ